MNSATDRANVLTEETCHKRAGFAVFLIIFSYLYNKRCWFYRFSSSQSGWIHRRANYLCRSWQDKHPTHVVHNKNNTLISLQFSPQQPDFVRSQRRSNTGQSNQVCSNDKTSGGAQNSAFYGSSDSRQRPFTVFHDSIYGMTFFRHLSVYWWSLKSSTVTNKWS